MRFKKKKSIFNRRLLHAISHIFDFRYSIIHRLNHCCSFPSKIFRNQLDVTCFLAFMSDSSMDGPGKVAFDCKGLKKAFRPLVSNNDMGFTERILKVNTADMITHKL